MAATAKASITAADERADVDWAGGILCIFTGSKVRRFFMLSYTAPIYILKKQPSAQPNPRFQFFFCWKNVVQPQNVGAAGAGAAGAGAAGAGAAGAGADTGKRQSASDYALFDTQELLVGEYMRIRAAYSLTDVTACASANDEAAILGAMGHRPWMPPAPL